MREAVSGHLYQLIEDEELQLQFESVADILQRLLDEVLVGEGEYDDDYVEHDDGRVDVDEVQHDAALADLEIRFEQPAGVVYIQAGDGGFLHEERHLLDPRLDGVARRPDGADRGIPADGRDRNAPVRYLDEQGREDYHAEDEPMHFLVARDEVHPRVQHQALRRDQHRPADRVHQSVELPWAGRCEPVQQVPDAVQEHAPGEHEQTPEVESAAFLEEAEDLDVELEYDPKRQGHKGGNKPNFQRRGSRHEAVYAIVDGVIRHACS